MDKSNYFQQGIMKEVKSNLGKWEIFHWILSRQRMTPKKDIKRKYKTYPHAHGPSVCSTENVLRGTEKNLNPDGSLASSGVH